MSENEKFNRIVEAAISGDETAKEQLTKEVSTRIRTYIYRSTLDNEVTGDILQEVYCKMFDSLHKLRKVGSFWPWVYRIASNCINTHYRSKYKSSKSVNIQDELLDSLVGSSKTSESDMMKKELSRAVIEAISTLNPRHRQIVTLRCFEDLSFKEIGSIEKTTEIYARVLFHRAIEKLRIALTKQGFSKASLVVAISLFGKLTAPSEAGAASVSVSASAVSGAGLGKSSFLTAKIAKSAASMSTHLAKTAIIGIAVTGVITAAASIGTLRSNVRSVHYFIQGVDPIIEKKDNGENITRVNRRSSSSSLPTLGADRADINYNSKGAYENKLVFPKGPDGPMLLFCQRWNMNKTGKLCSWLQDGSANYYYYSAEKKIYISNEPLPMLILPTDAPEFVDFIYSQVGFDSRFEYKRKLFSGLVKSTIDNRVADYADFACKYSYNTLETGDLANTWTKTDEIEDSRDEMHKRGWTSFEVSGKINGKEVKGVGQMPFVYDMYEKHKPWISVRTNDDIYIDYPGDFAGANCDEGILTLENESFFEGFCRPWEGIGCFYSVIRDAAKRRLRFTANRSESTAKVTVFIKTNRGDMKMVYDIDKQTDVINSIKYMKGDAVFGELKFKYIQNLEMAEDKKFSPPLTELKGLETDYPGMPWLVTLVNNS